MDHRGPQNGSKGLFLGHFEVHPVQYYNLVCIIFFKGNKRTEEATSKLSTFEIETINGDFTFYWYLNIFSVFNIQYVVFQSANYTVLWKLFERPTIDRDFSLTIFINFSASVTVVANTCIMRMFQACMLCTVNTLRNCSLSIANRTKCTNTL